MPRAPSIFFSRSAARATLFELAEEDIARLRHPDALLGALQHRFDAPLFGPSELALAHRALGEVPSFYQTPFFIATYHANRFENVLAIRSGFEAAIERYPANGRLHVAFATWLLKSRASLSGWQDPDAPRSLKDPLPVAERHMQRGMELEPELSWPALEALRVCRIPPERWVALTPPAPLAQRHPLDALLAGRYYEAGSAILGERLEQMSDPDLLRVAAQIGLEGGADLALNAAERWQAVLERGRGAALSLGSRQTLFPILEWTVVPLWQRSGLLDVEFLHCCV